MALTITCVSCGIELTEPGGILLTAPDDRHQVTKHHMCPGCTEDALDFVLSTIESPGGHEPAHPQPLVHVLRDLPVEPGDALAHVLAEAGPQVGVTWSPDDPDYFVVEGVRVPLHKDPNR